MEDMLTQSPDSFTSRLHDLGRICVDKLTEHILAGELTPQQLLAVLKTCSQHQHLQQRLQHQEKQRLQQQERDKAKAELQERILFLRQQQAMKNKAASQVPPTEIMEPTIASPLKPKPAHPAAQPPAIPSGRADNDKSNHTSQDEEPRLTFFDALNEKIAAYYAAEDQADEIESSKAEPVQRKLVYHST